jgi:uracil-DNA glycosylase
MDKLTETLKSIGSCNTCRLMKLNQERKIPYVPILPKPNGKFVFIGRDPSPRTAKYVGMRGGKSVFINEIFNLVDEAEIPEDFIYITDLCKCHWRTSRGKPLPGTEDRSNMLPAYIAERCLQLWLFKEIDILRPKVIISFGEELYQFLRIYVNKPYPVPEKLSATKDKSIPDAELEFNQNGAFKIKLGSIETFYVPLRHPGNTTSLVRTDQSDKRWQAYQTSRGQLKKLLSNEKV